MEVTMLTIMFLSVANASETLPIRAMQLGINYAVRQAASLCLPLQKRETFDTTGYVETQKGILQKITIESVKKKPPDK